MPASARLLRHQRHVRSIADATACPDRTIGHKSPQVLGHQARCLIAIRWLPTNCLANDRLQISRDLRSQLSQRRQLRLKNHAHQRCSIGVRKRRLQGEQLVKCQAKTVDVAPFVGLSCRIVREECNVMFRPHLQQPSVRHTPPSVPGRNPRSRRCLAYPATGWQA